MTESEMQTEARCCQLHNDSTYLTGNTQASDLDWLAQVLFDTSNVGAGCISMIHWLIGRDQWLHIGLKHRVLMGDGPRSWDMLTPDQAEAWRKLARIVLYVLPDFCSRVGRRAGAGQPLKRKRSGSHADTERPGCC